MTNAARQFGDDDSLRMWPLPSPGEGRCLIQAFLRIERPDLREEILKFVTEVLKVQDEGSQQRARPKGYSELWPLH